jgi:hypothetical protein
MKTTNPIVQGLIDYLEENLCGKDNYHKFKKTGPRSFFFQDDVDTVFVKVTDKNLIVITDGDEVIDNELSELICNSNGSDLTYQELRDNPYNRSLQTILHLF